MRTFLVGNNTFLDSLVVATGPCRLVGVIGYNSGADRFIHIHETASVPTDGSIPAMCFPADSLRAFGGPDLPKPLDMSKCTVVFSSTAETTTITSSTDASIQAVLDSGEGYQ